MGMDEEPLRKQLDDLFGLASPAEEQTPESKRSTTVSIGRDSNAPLIVNPRGPVHIGAPDVCRGPGNCQHLNSPESKLQADFHRHTGIWAPAAARRVLERLMTEFGFTAPKLRVAWQANNLRWDESTAALTAKTHWFEPLAGYFVVAIMCVYFVLEGGLLIVSDQKDTWRVLAAFAASVAMYGGMLWMVARFILMPYRIARKVQESLNLPGNHRSFSLGAVGAAGAKLVPFYRRRHEN